MHPCTLEPPSITLIRPVQFLGEKQFVAPMTLLGVAMRYDDPILSVYSKGYRRFFVVHTLEADGRVGRLDFVQNLAIQNRQGPVLKD
jgi:hypothetical protein